MLQQRPQLHFAPDAARFDIGEYLFQVANAAGERLHFTKTFIDLLKAFVYQREAFAQTAIERFMQLFIYGLAHFFKLFGVFRL